MPSQTTTAAALRGALTAADLQLHEALGIDADVLARAQVRRVTDAEARELGLSGHGDLSGVLYLYVQEGRPVTCRVRRDRPEMEDGKPRRKYLLPYGDRQHVYLSACDLDALNDANVLLVLVESETSALMLASVGARTGRPLAPVALGGCYGWHGRIGRTEAPSGARVDETGMLPDLATLVLPEREVIVWLDADAASNPQVAAAQRALTRELASRGARVRLARAPDATGTEGPNDYRARTDDTAVLTVLDGAQPARIVCATVAEHLAAAGLDALVINIATADLELRLRRLADTVRDVDPLRRQLVREAAIAALKSAKVSGAAGLVDAALEQIGHDHGGEAGTLLADDAPWPTPVDGAALLDTLAQTVRRYVVLPSGEAADAIALWILLAWAEVGVSILPLLTLTSPTKRCGKTTALTVVHALAPRALSVSGISPAALFRSVEKWHPTLLIDEADTVLPGNDDLRCVLNAGHTRVAAAIVRCVGEDQVPTPFSVWCPKVLAMIGWPKDTILDRSILVELRRKTPADTVERLRQDTIGADLAPLRRQCRRWADDHAMTLRGANPDIPARLNDRAADNWRGQLAIADRVGGEWPARARKAALLVSGAEDDGDLSIGVLLLVDVAEVWPADTPWLSTADLLAKLLELEDRPWRTFGRHERGLTQHKLARLLRDFKVPVDAIKDAGRKVNAYRWPALSEAITRYAPLSEAEPRNFADGSRQNSPIEAEPTITSGSGLKTQNALQRVGGFRGSGLITPDQGPDEDVEATHVA